ncbi:hypothetical protein BJX70DRAFT_401486 [Aspergillus crustosus]
MFSLLKPPMGLFSLLLTTTAIAFAQEPSSTSSTDITLAGVVLPTATTSPAAIITNPANQSETVPLGIVILPQDVQDELAIDDLDDDSDAGALGLQVLRGGAPTTAILGAGGVLIFPLTAVPAWLDISLFPDVAKVAAAQSEPISTAKTSTTRQRRAADIEVKSELIDLEQVEVPLGDETYTYFATPSSTTTETSSTDPVSSSTSTTKTASEQTTSTQTPSEQTPSSTTTSAEATPTGNPDGTNIHVNGGCWVINDSPRCADGDAYNVEYQDQADTKVTVYGKFDSSNTGDQDVKPGCKLDAHWPYNYNDIYLGDDSCLWDSDTNNIDSQCCTEQPDEKVPNPYYKPNTDGTTLHINSNCALVEGTPRCAGDLGPISAVYESSYHFDNDESKPNHTAIILYGYDADDKFSKEQKATLQLTAVWPSSYQDVYLGEDGCLYDSNSQKIDDQCAEEITNTDAMVNPYYDTRPAATCNREVAFGRVIFHIWGKGWITDGAESLKNELKGCAPVSDFDYHEDTSTQSDESSAQIGDYQAEFYVGLKLLATFKQGCGGRAIGSAGGPEIEC